MTFGSDRSSRSKPTAVSLPRRLSADTDATPTFHVDLNLGAMSRDSTAPQEIPHDSTTTHPRCRRWRPLVIIALQPAAFQIARSATIAAPAPTVFAQIDDSRNWQNSSPWEGIDSSMKRIYEGPTSGTGAAYSSAVRARRGSTSDGDNAPS